MPFQNTAPASSYRNNYPHADPGFRDLVKWQLTRKAPPKPKPFPLTPNDPAALAANRSRPSLTWVGHSTYLVQLEGKNFLTDPIFSDRASPFPFGGPRRITPVGITMESLPHIDFILISHNHYDHLDARSLKALLQRQKNDPPVIVTPSKLGSWFRHRGFPKVREIHWWESAEVCGLKIHAVPVQHWSQRIPFIVNRTRWAGFIVEGKNGRLLFPGDTGYSSDFKDIHNRLGPMTISLLPIGAYQPRWFMHSMHIGPQEAVQIHKDLGSKLSVAMHWGTFSLTDEPFDEPPQLLRETMKMENVPESDFWIFGHGETRWLDEVWK
jgi:N-acyl-phosphatidylethanolamine-hydrolysing phospholipase D